MPEGSTKDGIGASVRRKEDKRFLTGSGRYTADISRHGQLHVHFIRSDHAHANIKSIRTDAAAKADGVVAIYTGEDVAADGIGGPICGWVVTNRDGSPTNEPPHPILANGSVRYVGDHVVAVIAETLQQARDAAENLNFTSVTLNSNDPAVPSVIDIDALVDLLIGSGDE